MQNKFQSNRDTENIITNEVLKTGAISSKLIRSEGYTKIENHGVIFNNRTAGLVTSDGEIDWACFPNFDSDPVFYSLLDSKRGGFFRIRPNSNNFQVLQAYEEGTNILFTNFYLDRELKLKILDFLPSVRQETIYFSEIHRHLEAFSDVSVLVEFSPFDNSLKRRIIKEEDTGYMVVQGERRQLLSTDIVMKNVDGCLIGKTRLKPGQRKWLVTSYGLKNIYPAESFHCNDRLRETRLYWRDWISGSKYHGIYFDIVNRSLLTLKGLFFEPNGFMVAAPTTSLPESLQGDRNWDYRYTWARDTAYVVEVLLKVGYVEEATRFLYLIIDRIEREGKLRPLYSVSGRSDLKEREMPWEGYMKSKPVRFGNAASEQLQLDQYGSVINAVHTLMTNGGVINLHLWEKVSDIAEKILEIWKLPDNSLWEFRTERKHYVYSKVLIWRALKNAYEISIRMGVDGISERLKDTFKEIRKEIEKYGKSRDGRYYVQYFGSDSVDGSLLRLPLIGYCSAKDETFKNTLEEIEKRLMTEEFLFKRYENNDSLKGMDNAFLMLSFWYIEDLIMMGRINKAKRGLVKLMSLFNSLNLVSEEIDFSTHQYLGNYPQALSHLSLISAILRLNQVS